MRHVIALAIALCTACAASGPRPVNVAAVRAEIRETIAVTSGDRDITSMGKTSRERAIVYTTRKDGTRQEETWVKTGETWKLESATPVAAR